MDSVHGNKAPIHGSGCLLLTSFSAALHCPPHHSHKAAKAGPLYVGMCQGVDDTKQGGTSLGLQV
jgi:hypothetical protein